MDKLVRSIEIPMAKKRIVDAGLYLVPKERLEELSKSAADAYHGYPLHCWMTGGVYDEVASKWILKASVAAMWEDAVIYADSERLDGFAVWTPLGFTGSRAVPFLRSGGMQLLRHSGPGILRKLVAYESFAMKQKKKYTGHVDWYLYNLSVRRSAQGKGIARRLLSPMMEFCDDEKMVMYLETNKEENVSLYNRFGFELREECLIPGSRVSHFSMVREPK